MLRTIWSALKSALLGSKPLHKVGSPSNTDSNEKPVNPQEGLPYRDLKDMLKKHEGLMLRPYRCSAGKLSLGYGRNLDDKGISLYEAELLLDNDIQDAIREASGLSFYEGLNGPRKLVVVNMIFNLGLTRFNGFRRMIAALERRDYFDAAREMLNSRWAEQVGRRAVELANIMRSGGF